MNISKPLEGVRILEAGIYMALPICGRILSELGAEVIKVESHKALDIVYFVPNYKPGVGQTEYQGAKRRITLDLSRPEARAIFDQLLKVSDIFMTNYRKEVLESWGFDFSKIKAINPDMIILWQTGFGSTGAYSGYKVFGNIAQHTTGISTMSGFSEVPCTVNTAYSDYHASVFQAVGILAALERRRHTGQSAFIECSILKSGACIVGPAILDYQANGHYPQKLGNRDITAAPHGIYPCQGEDRWCAIAVFTEFQWLAFCNVIGNPDWTKEPRFTTLVERLRHIDELDKLVSEWTINYSNLEVMDRMQKAGVPAGCVSKGEDLAQSQHLKERGYYVDTTYYIPDPQKPGIEWQESPSIISSPVPIHFSETPLSLGHIHRIGEDNNYVYGKLLGMSKEEIETLTKEKVLF